LRLLKLPAEIQLGIKEHKVTMGHARSLVNIDDPKSQLKIYGLIIDQELSVRKVEEMVRKLSQEQYNEDTIKESVIVPKEYDDLKKHLQNFFNSKIEFKRDTKGSGKIVIPFSSDDDLERIIAIFDKLNA
jgi:ParB family transcriptional regulator, chromosome partitioning protein